MSKRNKQPRRQYQAVVIQPTQQPPRRWVFFRSVTWLGSAGLLVVFLTAGYQHFFGNITLEYTQALSRGYEFQLKNETPSDRVIKQFRVIFPEQKDVIFKITKDVMVYKDPGSNSVAFADGNIHEVPAARFKELDGRRVPANSSLKFRIPPLSDRSWVEPDATIVELQYSLVPANTILAMIDRALTPLGLEPNNNTVRYVVSANYWIPASSNSPNEAIRIACRDDSTIKRLSVCDGKR